MLELHPDNIIIQPVFKDLSYKNKVSVSVLRLDLIHPVISGNKWFKLKFYIEEARKKNKKTIITFGGAWSNHIVATACACSLNNLRSIGIIRGEEPAACSDTLTTAKQFGMEFCFVSRADYRKEIIPLNILDDESYIIPEGGYGEKGAKGFSTALEYCDKNSFTHFICAVGSGTMMAGIIKSVSAAQQVIGIPVLKNNNDLLPAIDKLLAPDERLREHHLIEDYHFGGYAKYTQDLIEFMNSFYNRSHVPSDFVYTGKLFYGVNDLIGKNYFPLNSNILVIHSGGLQANTSLKKGTLIF